jgi:hypothetical protein
MLAYFHAQGLEYPAGKNAVFYTPICGKWLLRYPIKHW